jgi:hypothetical protein
MVPLKVYTEMMIGLRDLGLLAYANAKDHGFYESPPTILERLCLIHSEVSEAYVDLRNGKIQLEYQDDGKPIGLPSEIADAIIRIVDLAVYKDLDLDLAAGICALEELTGRTTHFYLDSPDPLVALADIHSNISKCAEDYRSGDLGMRTHGDIVLGFPISLCQVVFDLIRLSVQMDFDLDSAIRIKMAYNRSRPYKHGKIA